VIYFHLNRIKAIKSRAIERAVSVNHSRVLRLKAPPILHEVLFLHQITMSRGPVPIIAAAAALTGVLLALYFASGCGGGNNGSDSRSKNDDKGNAPETKNKNKHNHNTPRGDGVKSRPANETTDQDHDHGVKRSRSMDSTLSDQEIDTEESSTIVSNPTTTSVDAKGGEGDPSKTSHATSNPTTPDAVATKEKKSRIKKQRLKKIHGMLKTTMDYLEQTADADEVITVASSPSFGRKPSAGGGYAVVVSPSSSNAVSEEVASEDAIDLLVESPVQKLGGDAEAGGGKEVVAENCMIGGEATAEDEPEPMAKQKAKTVRSLERSTTGEDAISEGENNILETGSEGVAVANVGNIKTQTEEMADKAYEPVAEETNAANQSETLEQTDNSAGSDANDVATELFNVGKSSVAAIAEAVPQTAPIVESSGKSANARVSTAPVSGPSSESANTSAIEELVTDEAASDEEYVGDVVDSSIPEDDTAALPSEISEPEQLSKDMESLTRREGEGLPTQQQYEGTRQDLGQSQPQQQAALSSEIATAQPQPSISTKTSPSKPIPVKEKHHKVAEEPMDPPTDTTDYSLLKTYWKKQSDKNTFKAPIEDVAAIKSVIAASTSKQTQQQLKQETQQLQQQQKKQQRVEEDPQLILNKGSGSDSSSNSKDGSEEEGYVKVLHSPSGIPMTESELLTGPVVGKEVEVRKEETTEASGEVSTAKIEEGKEEAEGATPVNEEAKAEKTVTIMDDEDSSNSANEESKSIDAAAAAATIKKAAETEEGVGGEADATPKSQVGKTDNQKNATSNKKKKKKKGKKK